MVPIDIAIRLANEGVPVQAIARATGWPFADLHAQLRMAQVNGDLITIPRVDWPAGYPREQKLQQLTRSVLDRKADLELTIRQIFGIQPRLAQLLLLLLLHSDVHRERIYQLGEAGGDSNTPAVYISHLRRALQRFGLPVQTLYGYGYRMRPEHQREALNLIFNAT